MGNINLKYNFQAIKPKVSYFYTNKIFDFAKIFVKP